MNFKDKINRREEANTLILKVITMYLHKHPYLRFGQALIDLKILKNDTVSPNNIDIFNEESVDLLNRLKEDLLNRFNNEIILQK
ncbi:hypothetical protein J6O48_13125 [bacterium]|nr:hypothetical protein [bacterium]